MTKQIVHSTLNNTKDEQKQESIRLLITESISF